MRSKIWIGGDSVNYINFQSVIINICDTNYSHFNRNFQYSISISILTK